MNDRPREERPAGVIREIGTKQAGDIRARWKWVEPEVWSERMLTALEEGVKGGKWFSLIDKVYALESLRKAFKKVKVNGGAAGVDHETTEMFERHLEENLEKLAKSLKEGSYHPQAVRRRWISKPGGKGKRPLGIPTVRDRVVQGALKQVLEPIFEKGFAETSYGFRPERGCKDALRQVNTLLQEGYNWVVDVDIENYYDTIPRKPMLECVSEKISDGKVLELAEQFMTQEVMDTAARWTPEEGTPQGAVISPLLSNIYLDPLDHQMAASGHQMIRYADDMVILCRSEAEAREALQKVQAWTAKAGLKLHPEKTRIVDSKQAGGFDFLGYHFERGYRWPRRKSLQKIKETLRAKTRRINGHSLTVIIEDINRSIKGWFEYFKHSHKFTFRALDQWIRMRLRSILRKRQGRRGRGRGQDHQRWPNAYFAKHGLFSLVAAHALVCPSSRR